ncbi:hypothetical protein CONCODRAFT_2431 [Conidiobolus coronatus NRRL 28638]|uniref:G-protein coupled receptors family 1 profile domain-containing protein n=1 Tax=Conidiobolus coronatus (strain ATCC 28846 / CBS 209.66 / NRRL 28638) TaxID=796925 RepID=A0A137PHE9_CONC2|nr:hypothetical protein CONCODRAFT_2431 [Conidiobolus coronatus NRRL 28638]|eukprot:KXN74423.1 hypothetical protein CONCODRAFT_2431 [Conidiobolus coronatus NRRL 28638]
MSTTIASLPEPTSTPIAVATSVTGVTPELRLGMSIEFIICGLLGIILNTLLMYCLYPKLTKKAHNDIFLSTFVVITDIFVSIGFPLYFWFILVAAYWIPPLTISLVGLQYNIAVLSKSKVNCTMMPVGVGYIYSIFTFCMFFSSFASVIISYCGIMIVKYRQCLNQINMNIPKDQVYSECRTTIIKSFVYILLYLGVFMSKFLLVIWELALGRKRTIGMDAASNCTGALSVVANALVLLYINNEVRLSFTRLLKSIIKS